MSVPGTNPTPPTASPATSMARFVGGSTDAANCRNSEASCRVYGWGNRSRNCFATLTLSACLTIAPASRECHGRTAHRDPSSLMSKERASLGAQPALGFAEAGAGRLHEAPESPRMVLLLQVHQLVDEHVVADLVGRLHEPEVERDGARAGARSPSRALVSDADARDGQRMTFRQLVEARDQLASCRRAEAALGGRATGRFLPAQPHPLVSERQPRTAVAALHAQRDRRSSERDLVPFGPSRGSVQREHPQPLPLRPVAML